MAKGVLKISGKPITFIIEKVRSIVSAITAAVGDFPTPNPPLPTITLQVNDLETKFQAAINGGKLLKADMRLALRTLMASMTVLLDYVNTTAAGDGAKIILAGIELRKSNSPVGQLNPPTNVRAVMGVLDGQIVLRFNGVRGRVVYKIQIKADGDTVWIDYTYTGKKNITIIDLNSGQPYDIRVATISAAGIGGWSNIVTQKAL